MASPGTARPEKEQLAINDEIRRILVKKMKRVMRKIDQELGFHKPSVNIAAIHVPTINHNKAHIIVDIRLTNPNPLPIPHVNLSYSFESKGRKLASGLVSDTGILRAHSSRILSVPIDLIYDNEIGPGSTVPYRVKIGVLMDVPIVGRISIPVEETGEISLPHKPDVDLVMINLEKLSLEEAAATVYVRLGRLRVFDMGVRSMGYEVWIDGVSVGGAQLERYGRPGERRGVSYVEVSVRLKPWDLGTAVWDVVRRRCRGYAVRGSVDVETPFGGMKMAVSKEGGTPWVKDSSKDKTKMIRLG